MIFLLSISLSQIECDAFNKKNVAVFTMNPNAPNRPPPQTAVSGVTQQMNQMNIRPRPPNPAPARPGFRPQGARPVARPQQRPTRPSLASQGSAPNQLGNAQSASQSPQMHSSANSPSGMANGSVPSQPTRMPPNQSFPSPPNQSGMTNGVAPNQAPKMPGNQSFPSSPNQSGLQAGQSGTSTGKPLMQPHSQQSQTFAPPAQNPSFRPPVQAADHSFMPNGMPNQPGVINQSFGQTGAPNQSFGQPGMINQQPGVNQPFGQHGMPAQPGIFGQPVTPNQSFGQPGMPSQSFGQPGMPSQSIGQPGMPSQSFGQPGMPNQSFGQPGMPGQTFGQPGIPHQSFGQPGIPNQSFGQPGMPAQNPSFRPPGQTTNQSIIPNGMPNQAGMQPSNPYGQSGSNFTAPGFQQQRPGFQAGPVKPKIDPDQIPNPAAVHALDEETHRKNIFSTTSRMQPPLAITRFRAQDHGSCNPRFLRSTLYNIPATNELLAQSGIPFGLICQPLADVDPLENPVPVADFTKMGPPRCLRCNAFINPYFQFVEGGRKFNCNICSAQSEVSPEYFANLDMNGRRVDINQRLELLYGSCDFAVANVNLSKLGILR
jgi:protein transport protein SEC24